LWYRRDHAVNDALTVREVRDPNDPVIAAFGRLQKANYFAPETLIPAEYIPRMLADGGETYQRRNFLVVAEIDRVVVGGTLFHWLDAANTGFSSFMAVDREQRRRGIGRRLHEERFRVLDRAADGRAQGVFIDVVNPTRLSAEDHARERRAGSDPWTRRRIFAQLGFRQVDIQYEQPVGGRDGGPVTNLDLLYCPRDPIDSIPTARVVDTMRAYWSGWLGQWADRYARELEARAHGAVSVALISPVPQMSTGNPSY
jgi:GNAT superfamily N-acetyltransferase